MLGRPRKAVLKTTTMPSRLGGSYAPDDQNHPHLPLFILGLRDGKQAVLATGRRDAISAADAATTR